MNSWSKGMQKQYSQHINQQFDYCTRQNTYPCDSSVNQGAKFLAEYFHESVSYSMVNTATSDLSSVSPAKDGAPFGKQLFIVKLLRDMFK